MAEEKMMYCNAAGLSAQFMDILLDFQTIYPDGQPADHMRIFMSPQHAKALLFAMKENIKKYEELFGEIPMLTEERTQSLIEQGLLMKRG